MQKVSQNKHPFTEIADSKKSHDSNGILEAKLERLKENGPPRVLDLFAGCGGLSLGFHAAGFKIVGAVEHDPDAAKSHALNFCKTLPQEMAAIHSRPRDIISVEPDQLIAELNPGRDPETCVDVLVGGPPCQAYARVGRAKLREVLDHPEAFLRDPRSNLYLRYLDYVRKLRPLAVLMENVPDVLNYGGHNIAEETCEVLGELGYVCRYTLLNSVYYGVPQMRERMFLIAYSRTLTDEVVFPPPSHWYALPKGYEGSRNVALRYLRQTLFSDNHFYVTPPPPSRDLAPAVTAQQALEDLPPITAHLEGRLKRGARRFTERVLYSKNDGMSAYAAKMRDWPGFEADGGICDHVIRYLPRDYAIFRRMNPGDQYPQAHQHAMNLLHEKLDGIETTGRTLAKDSTEYRRLKKETVPPYDPGKFPNKWRKMEADHPARTLLAHLGKDGYSNIHYDSNQARTISVREAARLQSFPDGFLFHGTMNSAFRQIGNAVPPLLALALATEIMKHIKRETTCRENLHSSGLLHQT